MPVYDQEIVDTTPLYLQSKSYSAQKDRTWFTDLASAGVFTDTDFLLSLLGGLAYRMSAGKAYVLGQQVADQGMYRVVSLSNFDLVVPAGHATLPRLDQVILRVMDNTHDGAGFNEARIETVPGTATSGATLANRSGATPLTTLGEASKNVLLLYDILMPAAASSISGGNVARKVALSVIGKGTLRLVEEELITVAQFSALTNLYDGQEARILVDATAGIVWTVKYRPASASSYKWEVIDASEIHAAVEGADTAGSGGVSWGNLATVGPSVAVPLAGEYDVEWGAAMSTGWDGSNNTSGPCNMGLSGAGFTAATAPSISIGGYMSPSTTQGGSASRKIRKALTVATITAKYNAGNSSGNATAFAQRFLSIRPVRISQ
jgi:hypothetical protein